MNDLTTSSPVARTVLVASLLAFLLAEVSIRLRHARGPRGARRDRGSIVAVVAGIAAGGIAAGWFSAHGPVWELPGSRVPFGIAVLLIWGGIALRQWAVFTLGRDFTVVVRVSGTQRANDRGPFRWVRHPSYTGLLLTLAGVGVAIGDWLSLASLIVLPSLGLAYRIRVEEAVLMSSLRGYREYAEGRPRLVPWIW